MAVDTLSGLITARNKTGRSEYSKWPSQMLFGQIYISQFSKISSGMINISSTCDILIG